MQIHNNQYRAGSRAIDLGGLSVYQGGQSLKLSTKAGVFKRVSLLIVGGGKHVNWGGAGAGTRGPPLAPALNQYLSARLASVLVVKMSAFNSSNGSSCFLFYD